MSFKVYHLENGDKKEFLGAGDSQPLLLVTCLSYAFMCLNMFTEIPSINFLR